MNTAAGNSTKYASKKLSFWVVFLFALYTMISFGIYLERSLKGDVNNHILAGEMFGTPVELMERGVEPLNRGAENSGWDGQFYYYMSNDIFGVKDTAKHIDSPSYRYQRIGLSLFSSITSKVFLQEWVSPSWYISSYFFLLIFATYAGARLLARHGIHPAFILLWSLSVGTQITLFNALPDAAADAFLILGAAALLSNRYALSVIPLCFAALSREAYALFPSAVLLLHLLYILKADNDGAGAGIKRLMAWRAEYFLVIPGAVTVAWYLYVSSHFGIAPSSQAYGVLGLPLISWFECLISGLQGNHIFVGGGFPAYAEAISLLIFMIVLLIAGSLAIKILISSSKDTSLNIKGLALGAAVFVVMYISFGMTVITHYTGYFKALSLFFFLVPLFSAYAWITAKNYILYFLIISQALVTIYNFKVRILPYSNNFDDYTQVSKLMDKADIPCFDEYKFMADIKSVQVFSAGTVSKLFGGKDYMVMDVRLTNTGTHDFVSTRGKGSVHMSYHWIDSSGKAIADGIRTTILEKITPGKAADLKLVSYIPKNSEGLTMNLSPVQEGCAWFYQAIK